MRRVLVTGVSGVGKSTTNLGTFQDRFDVIVLLSAPGGDGVAAGGPGRIRVRHTS